MMSGNVLTTALIGSAQGIVGFGAARLRFGMSVVGAGVGRSAPGTTAACGSSMHSHAAMVVADEGAG
jgi:hypothetical protein